MCPEYLVIENRPDGPVTHSFEEWEEAKALYDRLVEADEVFVRVYQLVDVASKY